MRRLGPWVREHPGAAAGGLLLAAVVLAVFGAPLWCAVLGVDPHTLGVAAPHAPPGGRHLLGTDELGRDVFARILAGGRVSLAVAGIAAALTLLAGGAAGLFAGFIGGAFDRALMRLTEALLAVPKLPLMLILAAVDLGALSPRLAELPREDLAAPKLIVIITALGWMSTARLARAVALRIREEEFVLAARALGWSRPQIVLRHLLPHAAPVLLVATAQDLGELIIYESVLSFLGLGIPPPAPSWGALLSQGMTLIFTAPMLVVIPGAVTFATVAAANALGEGLRDTLDPRA